MKKMLMVLMILILGSMSQACVTGKWLIEDNVYLISREMISEDKCGKDGFKCYKGEINMMDQLNKFIYRIKCTGKLKVLSISRVNGNLSSIYIILDKK